MKLIGIVVPIVFVSLLGFVEGGGSSEEMGKREVAGG